MKDRDISVLILSTSLDFPTDRICNILSRQEIPFLRLNRDQLTSIAFTIDPCSATMICRYKKEVWTVGRRLRSVLWRQATFLRNTPSSALTLDEQLERSQWSAAMRGLMLFDDARWINHPAATYRAESKPYQLRRAAKLGFDVPSTIITNDTMADVSQLVGDRIALKSVDTVHLTDDRNQYFGYTSIVDWSECSNEYFHLAPATCQAVIEQKLDLRVTVVGNQLWCDSVTHHGNGIEGDWRLLGKDHLSFQEFTLPEEVSERCKLLVRDLGLIYGAIDLALSSGKYWFIEINPTGEWGWLDRENRGISGAIADELLCLKR